MKKMRFAMVALMVPAMLLLASGSGAAEQLAEAKGSLDKEVIRRVVQRHISEVKKCYETELQKDKGLAGRVVVRVRIGADGKVQDASIEESSLKSPAGEKCITDAVQSWEFPRPRGGAVLVSYPFVLDSRE